MEGSEVITAVETLLRSGWDAAALGDQETAKSLWEKASALGSGDADCLLAIQAERAGDVTTAADLYSLAAARGNLTAMLAAAMPLVEIASRTAHELSSRVVQGFLARRESNFDRMRELFEEAAESGDPHGLFASGLAAYEASDDEAAASWWKRAFEDGDVRGAWALGVLAAETGDVATAAAWRGVAEANGFTPEK
jgi:TPR repeat protein